MRGNSRARSIDAPRERGDGDRRGPVSPDAVALHLAARFGKIGTGNLSARVAGAIEEEILNGNLQSGQRLPTEATLCEIFGVSRSVIRDAMRALATLNLVTIAHGRGMLVAEPTSDRLVEAIMLLLMRSGATQSDVWSARSAIEIGIVPFAARSATDEDFAGIEEALREFKSALDDERWDDCARWHLDFHRRLLEAVRLPALALLLQPMQKIILLSSIAAGTAEGPDRWDYESHPPILKALRSRSEGGVRRALEAHFERGFDRNTDQSNAPFSASRELMLSIVEG